MGPGGRGERHARLDARGGRHRLAAGESMWDVPGRGGDYEWASHIRDERLVVSAPGFGPLGFGLLGFGPSGFGPLARV